jgi:hypothetical protein
MGGRNWMKGDEELDGRMDRLDRRDGNVGHGRKD